MMMDAKDFGVESHALITIAGKHVRRGAESWGRGNTGI